MAASITCSLYTSTSLTVRVQGLTVDNTADRYCHFYCDTSQNVPVTETYRKGSMTITKGYGSCADLVISGLSSNKTYYIKAVCKNGDGTVFLTLETNFTTNQACSLFLSTSDYVGPSSNQIYAQLINLPYYSGSTRTIYWFLNDTNKGSTNVTGNPSSGKSDSFTFSNLNAGTTYSIKANLTISSSNYTTYTKSIKTASAPEPSLTVQADKYQIYVRVNNPPGTGTRYCHWYCSSSSSDYGDEISVQTITGNIAQTSDLTLKQARGNSSTYLILPSTKYYIQAVIKTSSNSTLKTLDKTITTDPTEISAFIWTGKNYTNTTSNPAATAAQTKAAKTALDNLGKTEDFSYLVWNDMVRKCNDIRSARGLSWDGTHAPLGNTKMDSSEAGRTLTATRFNSLRYNIGSMYSTGIETVAAGDTVKASYFTTLVTKMNAVR